MREAKFYAADNGKERKREPRLIIRMEKRNGQLMVEERRHDWTDYQIQGVDRRHWMILDE
ncbi:MAG: hypothetical protein ACFFDD_14500 [Promethearchaeota archaeon]